MPTMTIPDDALDRWASKAYAPRDWLVAQRARLYAGQRCDDFFIELLEELQPRDGLRLAWSSSLGTRMMKHLPAGWRWVRPDENPDELEVRTTKKPKGF